MSKEKSTQISTSKATEDAKEESSNEEEERQYESQEARDPKHKFKPKVRWKKWAKYGMAGIVGGIVSSLLAVAHDMLQEPADEDETSLRRALTQETDNFSLFPQSLYVFGAVEAYNIDALVSDLKIFRDLVRAEDLLIGILKKLKNVKAKSKQSLLALLYISYKHFCIAWSLSKVFHNQVYTSLIKKSFKHTYDGKFRPQWLSLRALLVSTIRNICYESKAQFDELQGLQKKTSNK